MGLSVTVILMVYRFMPASPQMLEVGDPLPSAVVGDPSQVSADTRDAIKGLGYNRILWMSA